MELQRELKLDIAIVPETQKKLKGLIELGDYILVNSDVAAGKRAATRVTVIINKRLKNKIHSYQFVNCLLYTSRCV